MAQPDVNLGSVGFGLVANTESLERSLSLLSAFGERVNRAVANSDSLGDSWVRQSLQIERSLSSQLASIERLNSKFKALGQEGSAAARDLNTTYERLTQTLSKGRDRAPQELSRGFQGMAAEIARATQAAKDFNDQQKQIEAQQKALFQAQQRASAVMVNMGIKGAPDASIQAAKNALSAYEAELAKGTLSTAQLAAANQTLVASLNQTTRQFREQMAAAAAAKKAATEQARDNSAEDRQQKALFQAQQRTQNIISNLGTKGAPQEFSDQAAAALARYEAALARGTLSSRELMNANQTLTASLNSTVRAFREQAAAVSMSEKATASYAKQAQAVSALNIRAGRLGVSPEILADNGAALLRYNEALKNGNNAAQANALGVLQASMQRTKDAISEAARGGQTFANVMNDINKATILAAGPLSGFGARVSVIASLLENTTAKTVMFIAGTVGMGVAVATLATNAIKAGMEMEKFNALLTSASGASALNRREFEYLNDVANKFGQRIQGLVQPYTQFGTAARLSGMSLATQRDIFESVLTAGTALRFDTEKTGRAFLALEQMVSKGQVQMQELKLQFGQVIPGAMEIAAVAMGKTTAELLKMMEAGTLRPNDFLPKLAKALKDMFGAGATEGSKTLQAEIERLYTATFKFSTALDESTRASEGWRAIIVNLTGAINFLTGNMQQVIAITAAIGAAFLTVGTIMATTWGITAVAGTTSVALALSKVRAELQLVMAVITGSAALVPGVLGGWIGAFLKVGLAIAAGTAAYKLFNKEIDVASEQQKKFNQQADVWLQSVEQVGYAHKRVYDQMKQRTAEQIELIGEQIMINAKLIETQNIASGKAAVIENSGTRDPNRKPRQGTLARGYAESGMAIAPGNAENIPVSPAVTEAERQQGRLKALLAETQETMSRINKIKDIKDFKVGDVTADDKGKKAWDSWIKAMQQELREVQMLDKELIDSTDGIMRRRFEAEKKADDMIARMPTEHQRSLDPMINQLAKAGFASGDAGSKIDQLRRSLILLYEAESKNRAELQIQAKTISDFARNATEAGRASEELRAKIRANDETMRGVNPEEASARKQLEVSLERLRPIWMAITRDVEGATRAEKEYVALWRQVADSDKQIKGIEDIRKEWEKLSSQSGGNMTVDKIWREYFHGLEVVKESSKVTFDSVGNEVKKVPTYSAEAAKSIEDSLGQELWRKLWEASNDYGKKFKSVLNTLEQDIASSVVDGFMGKGKSFKDFLNKMEAEIATFIIKIGVIRPALEQLFGSLYSGKASQGDGLLGGLIKGALGLSNVVGTQSPAPVESRDISSAIGGSAKAAEEAAVSSAATAAATSLTTFTAATTASDASLTAFTAAGSAATAAQTAFDASVVAATTVMSSLTAAASSAAAALATVSTTSGTSSAVGAIGGAIGGAAGTPAFAEGGSFRVGGGGGTDSQIVRFRATPGETVTVRTPGQQEAISRSVQVTNHFYISGNPGRETQEQIAARTGRSVQRAVSRSS